MDTIFSDKPSHRNRVSHLLLKTEEDMILNIISDIFALNDNMITGYAIFKQGYLYIKTKIPISISKLTIAVGMKGINIKARGIKKMNINSIFPCNMCIETSPESLKSELYPKITDDKQVQKTKPRKRKLCPIQHPDG